MRSDVILAVGFALSLTAGGPAVADGGGGGSDRSNIIMAKSVSKCEAVHSGIKNS